MAHFPLLFSLYDGVKPWVFQIVQKLSVRPPSLEIKLKLLKQIASENGMTLKNLEDYGVPTEVRHIIINEMVARPLCWEIFENLHV